MCLAGLIFAVQMAQWICHKLITHWARRGAVSSLFWGDDKDSGSKSTVNQEKFLIQPKHPTQQNLRGRQEMTEGKQRSSMGSLTTKKVNLLLICFPQKRASCPWYMLSLFTILNTQHFLARIRAAHLASNFIYLSLLEHPGRKHSAPLCLLPVAFMGTTGSWLLWCWPQPLSPTAWGLPTFLLSNTSWPLGPRPTASTQFLLLPGPIRPQRGGKSKHFPVGPLRLCQHIT